MYVNFAFNISNFYKLTDKFNALQKKDQLIEVYCKSNKMEKEKYSELAEDPENCPKDFPSEKKGMCKPKQILNYKDIKAEIESTK
jgi:hypothetical protein